MRFLFLALRQALLRAPHIALGIVAGLTFASPFAHAAGKNVEMVVPIAAGGAMDAAGRVLADELSRRTGDQFLVLNKAGAATMIGTRYVADQAPADGSVLLLGAAVMTATEFQSSGTPFNVATLAPVAYVGWQVTVLYVRESLPVNTMAEFIEWARKAPQGVVFGSSGNGSTPHLAAEELAVRTGIQIVHAPFAGAAASIPALVGGHIDAVFDAPSTRSLVKAGKLKALMVGSGKPLHDWADLPTADASGLPGFRSGGWYGLFVPARTSGATVKKLNEDINAALGAPVVREKLATLGIEPAGGSPEEFSRLISTQRERLRQLVKARQITFN